MAEVEFRNCKKVYEGGVTAVSDFTLKVGDREFVVFVGPSGCGKSTALRMIAGLEEITEGDLLIDGRRVNDVQPKDRDIAMVFQNYALYPHMNVYDNMAFGLKLRKFPRPEIDGRVRDAAQILGLADFLGRKPKALSGGQRQRVAVGRAIVRKPKAFLFDEPLSNLDAKMRVQMRKELCQIHRKLQATMIYVTHDQVEAMTMGDRIVVIKDGRIQQIGTPMEIYRKPANEFVAGFIGSPPMNFIECEVRDRGLIVNNAPVAVPASSLARLRSVGVRKVKLGVRPEDLAMQPIEGGFSLEGSVDLNELLGSEMLVYLSAGASLSFIAKLLNGNPLPAGEAVRFYAPWESLYYFDAATGRAL